MNTFEDIKPKFPEASPYIYTSYLSNFRNILAYYKQKAMEMIDTYSDRPIHLVSHNLDRIAITSEEELEDTLTKIRRDTNSKLKKGLRVRFTKE